MEQQPLLSVASPRPRRDDWGVGEWLAWFFGTFVFAVMVVGVVSIGGGEGPEPPRTVLAGATALPTGMLAWTVWALRRRTARTPAEVFQTEDGSVVRDVGVGALTGVGVQFVIGIVYNILKVEAEQDVARELDRIVGVQLAVLVLLVAAVAPIAEEMFFRVLLFDVLRRRLARAPWAALFIQGAVFGLIHISPLAALPALAFAGVCFGALLLRGRSVWAAVSAHMAFNAFAVIGLLQ